MLDAGKRPHRIRFERRAEADDGFGNVRTAYSDLFKAWAGFRPQFGREQIAAGQLQSTMLGTVTVLRSARTAGITAADRIVFTAGAYAGTVCQIRSIVPTPDNAEYEMTVESGVAT